MAEFSSNSTEIKLCCIILDGNYAQRKEKTVKEGHTTNNLKLNGSSHFRPTGSQARVKVEGGKLPIFYLDIGVIRISIEADPLKKWKRFFSFISQLQ